MTTEPEQVEPGKKPARKRSTKSPKPIDSSVGGQSVKTKTEIETSPVESPEELASRLRREEAREAHELFKEKAVLTALLVVTGVLLLAALCVLSLSDKPNLQSWATAALSSILAGYFGWFTGKGTSTPRR